MQQRVWVCFVSCFLGARLRAKGLPARSSFALAKCRMLMNAKDFTQIEVTYIQMQKADPDFRRPKRYYC